MRLVQATLFFAFSLLFHFNYHALPQFLRPEVSIADDSGILIQRPSTDQTVKNAVDNTANKTADKAADQTANKTDEIRTLIQMEQQNLKQGASSAVPWSGFSWPLLQGSVGQRYADPRWPNSSNWHDQLNYIQSNKMSDIWQSRNATQIQNLSPAEKYDLLILNPSRGLTPALWQEGTQYYSGKGGAPSLDLQKGWALSASLYPEPKRAIDVQVDPNASSTVTFYPDDIKALLSFYWARISSRPLHQTENAALDTSFMNGAALSPSMGRTISPARFHIQLANHVGSKRKSIVVETNVDNHPRILPLYSYAYHYFNPLTNRMVDQLQDAQVKVGVLFQDPYKRGRSPKAHYVVGIINEVTYTENSDPAHEEHIIYGRGPKSSQKTVYVYDLELDQSGKIIGGQWRQAGAPLQMWIPSLAVHPNPQMARDESWNGMGPLPASWLQEASQDLRRHRASRRIVEALLHTAQDF